LAVNGGIFCTLKRLARWRTSFRLSQYPSNLRHILTKLTSSNLFCISFLRD
jgi:hypothetical protein